MSQNKNTTHIFKELWIKSPLSWAIIRAREVELLSQQTYIHPILEVGCGDGLVSQFIFNFKKKSIDVGLDRDFDEVIRARKTDIYKKLIQGDITQVPFNKEIFCTVFANGVLEHIPNLSNALSEISRILKTGGYFITTSPTNNYSKLLFYSRLFSALKLKYVANKYENFINAIFHHVHLYDHIKWEKLLKRAGFKLIKYQYYNSDAIIAVHDIGLPLSLPVKVFKALFDKLVLFSSLRSFVSPLVTLIFSKLPESSSPSTNASILLVAQKVK